VEAVKGVLNPVVTNPDDFEKDLRLAKGCRFGVVEVPIRKRTGTLRDDLEVHPALPVRWKLLLRG
jgi:hypothetical protein